MKRSAFVPSVLAATGVAVVMSKSNQLYI